MHGARAGSPLWMRTLPRLVGLRLHTLAVNALNGCSGSPNASSESGWTWYSRLACASPARLFANAPSCDGAMLIGPLRDHAYWSAMRALPQSVEAIVFRVCVPSTP